MVSLEAAHANEARLLKYLEEQGIPYEKVSHPVVMTVEEQAAHVGHVEGALAKNLLLKDKKGRLILVTALTSTPVDLKLLSQRLGLGKGGLRMAPLESLGAVLQVPEGSVTPMALFSDTARSLPLLLDQGLRSQPRLLFHPLTNDATLALSRDAFEAFLGSLGREANYIDLEAVVPVGKDQPPDLAPLLHGTAGEAAEPMAKGEGGAGPGAQAARPAPAGGVGNAAGSSAAKKPEPAQKPAGVPGDDVATCADDVLRLLSGQPGAEGAAPGSAHAASNHLREDLKDILVMFKNAAYTHGFSAAKACASPAAW